MKVLLDECLPVKLWSFLPGHEVSTVADMGWLGLKNGRLLAATAAAGFDVLVTVDRGMMYQQNHEALPCTVLILESRSNALPVLKEAFALRLLPFLERALERKVYQV